MIVSVDEKNFEQEVLNSDKPVFVDCYAEWCSPCQTLKPVLEKFELNNSEKVKVAFMNIDNCPNLALTFRISSIPKVLVFLNGKKETSVEGLNTQKTYQSILDGLIESSVI